MHGSMNIKLLECYVVLSGKQVTDPIYQSTTKHKTRIFSNTPVRTSHLIKYSESICQLCNSKLC
jgi:hypothetical protein